MTPTSVLKLIFVLRSVLKTHIGHIGIGLVAPGLLSIFFHPGVTAIKYIQKPIVMGTTPPRAGSLYRPAVK